MDNFETEKGTKNMEETIDNALEATRENDSTTNTATKVRTKSMSETYAITGVDSLELISNRIITLLTMNDVKTAKMSLKMNILTDELLADKEVQTKNLSQTYAVSGADALPLIFDHVKSLYELHSIPGIKDAKVSVSLQLFVPQI